MSRSGVEPKPPWSALPSAVRRSAADALDGEIARAARIWGGYGPSPTFRLRLADGRRAFFKGCGPDASEFIREVVLTEERVYRELTRYITPWAPALLGAFQVDGWHALLLEDLGPKTTPPWPPALTQRIMRAYADYHAASLGAALPDWLPRFTEGDAQITWPQIAEASDGLRRVAALAGAQADEALRWLEDATPLYSRLLAQAPGIPGPYALLHFDTRSDNLRLLDGHLRLFDWPAVEVGPIELDVVAFAQSIAVEGGPPPEQCLAWYGGELRPDVVDITLAWCVGFFALRAWGPEIPGLPRLRRFQRQQLATLLVWSARRFGQPTPEWTAALTTQTVSSLNSGTAVSS